MPGLLLGIGFMCWSSWVCKRNNYTKAEPAPWAERWRAFKDAFFALMTPVIVIGGMFGGLFTATEAAAVASLYVMILGFFVFKTLTIRDLPTIFWNTVEQTAKVMFVIATAGFFQYVLLYTRIPQQAIAFISTSFSSVAPVLLIIIVLLVLMGCFMEGTAILLITVPIFVPLAKSFGYDIVQLGIVMCISLAVGVLTPPVGLNLYVMSSITGEKVMAIARHAVGYVLIMILAAIAVAFIPGLSLGLAALVPWGVSDVCSPSSYPPTRRPLRAPRRSCRLHRLACGHFCDVPRERLRALCARLQLHPDGRLDSDLPRLDDFPRRSGTRSHEEPLRR